MATTPAATITERQPKKFEPRSIEFPDPIKKEINDWLFRQIESLKKRLQNLHEKKVPEWRRIVDGKPREENRSWPFPNCSNLVHQLAGEAVDDLAARVLQLIWMTSPLAIFRYFDEDPDSEGAANNTRKARILEKFIDYVAFEPRELDLYERENRWYVDAAGLGKGRVCIAPEHRMEAVYVGLSGNRAEFENRMLYEGPKVVNLRYEDILVDPDVDVFEENDPIVRYCSLKKRQLQERTYKGFFKKDEAKKIMEEPDRYGPNEIRRRENQRKGITDTQDTTLAEWDIYECYFSWYHNSKKHRLIAWYHLKTKTVLNCVYNFIPDNQVPIIETKLTVNSKGFAEMLKDNQEEVSTAKNQRTDAITWGMLGINTISPQNKNLDRNFTLFPGVALPVNKDEFMHYEVANPAVGALSLQNEQAMIMQAKERAGVSPAISGMGASQPGKKGQFGSMGTLAVLGAGNSRNDHRQSDFRSSHVKVISLLTDFYGFMGLGRRGTEFGINDKLLQEALSDYLERKSRIPIRAATASMNKEVTKQNEIILNQAVSAYIKETSQALQAFGNATAPDLYKAWLQKVIIAKTLLMQQIIRDFQISDQPTEFIPNIEFPKEQQNAPQGKAGAPPGADGLAKVAEFIQRSRGGGGAGQLPGMGGIPGGLPGEGGGPFGPGGA